MKIAFKLSILFSILSIFEAKCGIDSCQVGYRLDAGSCQCVPQLRSFCRKSCKFRRFLTNKCKCVKKKPCGINLCSKNFEFDKNSCSCSKSSDVKCAVSECHSGFELNEHCQCVPKRLPTCRRLCRKGFTVYPGTCSCVPERTCHIKNCENPAMLNDSCMCEFPEGHCDIECPEGTKKKSPCECIPDEEIDTDDGGSCYIKKCKKGMELNAQSCECEEKIGPVCLIMCPPGQRVYPGFCQCVEEYDCEIQSCKYPAILDDFCECAPSSEISSEESPDPGSESTTESEEVETNPDCFISECADSFRLNSEGCQCEPQTGFNCEKSCDPDFEILDAKNCECVENDQCFVKSCRNPFFLNDLCECEPPQDYCDVECPPRTKFEFPCQCVPSFDNDFAQKCLISKCKKQFQLDEENCECQERMGIICKIGCPPGMKVYPNACKCVPEIQCGIKSCSDATLDIIDCSCS